LSNFDFVTLSFTFIAGTFSVPFLAISYRRCTPVVVSSLNPRIGSAPEKNSGCFSWMTAVRSPPSSRIMFGPLPPANALSCISMQS